ncbi:hypothetical protein CKO40_07425 [Halochromatium glycolicum]|uniref:Uncharacterized protein n=1 Tax=Halochromatium glycolicum TaxID=85075 RepID=A0AAJ0X9M9_9GAMM|nr:hypothetical protein [Halochromatium glycolicum]
MPRVGRVRAAPRVGAPAGHLGGDEGLSNQDLRALRKYPSREIGRLQNGLVVMQLRRLAAKAISVKAHTALLVFSLAFFVAPPVT